MDSKVSNRILNLPNYLFADLENLKQEKRKKMGVG